VASEECECRKIGSPTKGAAGQPKERRGNLRSGVATEGAAWQPKERRDNRRSGGTTEGAAGQPKERQGDPQRGLRPKKGFRCFGAEVIFQ